MKLLWWVDISLEDLIFGIVEFIEIECFLIIVIFKSNIDRLYFNIIYSKIFWYSMIEILGKGFFSDINNLYIMF